MLVDTGTGGANGVGGALIANLALLGVRPEEIDTILLTHAHPDHIGGLLTAAGTPAYPNAMVFLPSRESAYWLAPSTLDNASDRGQRNVLLVRRIMAICATQIRDIDEDEPVAGIRPCPLPGHTPGHTGYRLEAGGTSLLIWGDIVHFPSIQSARPEVSVAFDVDPDQARHTRESLLRQAASERCSSPVCILACRVSPAWRIPPQATASPGVTFAVNTDHSETPVVTLTRPGRGVWGSGLAVNRGSSSLFYFCSWLWWRPMGDAAGSTEDPERPGWRTSVCCTEAYELQ